MGAELSLFQEVYSFVSLILVFSVFLAVYFKKGNGLLAFSIAAGVMLFTIVIAPFNNYIIGTLNYVYMGKEQTFTVTGLNLKIFMVAISFVSIIIVNRALLMARIKYPYGKSRGDED
jgi:hypothetical protein